MLRRGTTALVGFGLVLASIATTTLSSGPLGPAASVVVNDAHFPNELVDETSSCDQLRVGVGVRDITPGVKQPDGSYALWEEPYEDTNGNGWYDAPNPLDPTAHVDPFTDENRNGKWDGPFMAGYGHDQDGSDGKDYYTARTVHDPVWARALALACGDLLVGMVSLDVVGLFQQHVHEIRERVSGAGFDHVVVASTHTHDSVDTMGLWGPNEVTDGKDPRTLEHVVRKASAALMEAWVTLEDVTVRAGAASTQAPGIVEFAGYVQTDLRDPFAIDDLVLAAQFVRSWGPTKATLVNWSPHPETLCGDKSEISSDFADRLRSAIETEGATVGGETLEALGGSAVYFSGAVGGMMTTLGARVFAEGDAVDPLPQCSYVKSERIGEVAAFAAMRAIDEGTTTTVDGLRVQVREVTFPIDNAFLAALNTIGLFEHPVGIGPARVGALDPLVGVTPPVPFITTELNVITLTAQDEPFIQIVTVPGELLPEIAIGGHMASEAEPTPENCFVYNALKHEVVGSRHTQFNPATGEKEPGYERILSAHADLPPEPVLRDHMKGAYNMLFGLANDELGYIVPANDFVPALPAKWSIVEQDLSPYQEGTDRCGDDDHYEETVSASSVLAPIVANNLAHMLDPAFVPAEYPLHVGDVFGVADGVEPVVDGEAVGVWLDTSGSNGYEAEEDARVQASLPGWVSGAWGFVGPHGEDRGQTPGEHVRGLWVDLDNDGSLSEADGVVFVDHWAFDG